MLRSPHRALLARWLAGAAASLLLLAPALGPAREAPSSGPGPAGAPIPILLAEGDPASPVPAGGDQRTESETGPAALLVAEPVLSLEAVAVVPAAPRDGPPGHGAAIEHPPRRA